MLGNDIETVIFAIGDFTFRLGYEAAIQLEHASLIIEIARKKFMYGDTVAGAEVSAPNIQFVRGSAEQGALP